MATENGNNHKRRTLEGMLAQGKSNKYAKVFPDPQLVTKKLVYPTSDVQQGTTITFSVGLAKEEWAK